jgi:hypothetical protein
VEWPAYGQHVDLIPQYAAELVKARVDLITAAGDETVRALQQTTKTIPFAMYYNFIRTHKTLRTTPAMAAGVTSRLWEIGDIVDVLEPWEAVQS